MKKELLPQEIRTRVAPSPTGPMHIATARVALYNYIFAKQNNGKFILRIEDTDTARSKQEWTDEIITDLKWLGTNWDEGPDIGGKFGPYKQSQKADVYEKYLKQLLNENKAYYCFCSEEELEAKRQDQMTRGVAPIYDGKCSKLSSEEMERNLAEGKKSVIRFKVEKKKVKFHDIISEEVEFDMALLGDIVIAKNLQTALFHFTVVIDDYEMKISHIIRGDDHLSNTARQILIQEAFGFPRPIYAHSPMILNPDRSKMSKRKNDVALASYIKKGYLPEAIINFIALLGWNPGTEKEIFTLSELEKEFSLEKVQKAGAVFNIQKLDNINGYYIREKSIEKLTELCLPYLIEAGLLEKFANNQKIVATGEEITKLKLEKIIFAYKERLKKLSEIVELTDFFFKDKLAYEKELLQWQKMSDSEIKESLLLCDKILDELNQETGEWNIKKMEEVLFPEILKFNLQKSYPENNKGFVMWPLRVALSGKKASASPFEIAEILGKQKTLKRIADAIKLL
ncbi:MAG: glutamate--tRNA ligase [Candidatus Staskawiczbacteria bacterium RIFOXYB2_FULL_32_9]|uniref:Glutamate--tRNA ligase n=1 Tax=Candidatus Staskawiczbacteria bacterium RIFOXYD1_FULL_32_13 TaxID=1802234 RepID=A0A1G2JQF6_9BACT|nr:MAG: Glutamate-tRNA ligase [Parcubacteria group bacterium GW2011_GWC2_32_10]OGZ80533.1 MAG: glutamate--tRNA ligase [Candidatus Staskawiczbacteria bacterium RIFOXYB1_FULL_32_11]OGZ83667.1 MAG: glutamate--tRNA ligase [Candidatus Staskawiczbacteria bacterium RIFOXYB2_FULL_32_9]OGZ89173.1 MAG: glutamate--tRNA ligase [Candidatus Staskawiczbacteria bacterium RIFOXYD1_FULL_32_13]